MLKEKHHCLIHFFLLITIFVGLSLTTSEYITCDDVYLDELLDLAFECHHPDLPILAPRLNDNPPFFHLFEILRCQRVMLPAAILRC